MRHDISSTLCVLDGDVCRTEKERDSEVQRHLNGNDRYKGKSFGEWLLIDALRKLLAASDSVAFPVVIVDAKDGAKHFYERYGFQAFEDAENKLFITIADVRASLG